MKSIKTAVGNIDSESRKMGYNPETGTNWCHLPMEMRMECLKYMSFKTRTCLRATATTEKLLVDSEKFHLAAVELTFLTHMTLTTVDDKNEMISFKTSDHHEKTLLFLKNLLEKSEMPNIRLVSIPDYWEHMSGILQIFGAHAPLRFKYLNMKCNCDSTIFGILKMCEKIEKLTLEFMSSYFDPFSFLGTHVLELLRIPVVATVKHLRVFNIYSSEGFVHHIVQKWIEIDAEVGTTLHFKRKSLFEEKIDEFVEKCSGRVVRQRDKKVRVRMDNESKHVLVQMGRIVLCVVIPADVSESDEDDWLEKIPK